MWYIILQIAQQLKEMQDRTHDLDMRAQEMRKSVSTSGDIPKALVAQRSMGVNTLPLTESSKEATPNNAVAFNMLMRIVKRGTSVTLCLLVRCKSSTSIRHSSLNHHN